MLNPSHAKGDKIFHSKVLNVTHNIRGLKLKAVFS